MISCLPTDETLRFLAHMLQEGQRILEVGCGRGELAAALGARGFKVTAVDSSERAAQAARALGVDVACTDFLAYEAKDGGLFDAVLFTQSLHHIPALAAAVDRAYALLQPDGVLIAEEFGLELADAKTARWFYETEALLEAAELLAPREHQHHPDHQHHPGHHRKSHSSEMSLDPLARWRAAYEHTPPLHTSAAMEVAVMSRFAQTFTTSAPYLYRSFCARLPEEPRGHHVARLLFDIESRHIADETLVATGVRLAARKEITVRSLA